VRNDQPGASLNRSERRILKLIFQRHAVTQAAIAEATDLTQQSVSRIVAKLTDEGLLVAAERIRAGRRGQPSAAMAMAAGYRYAAGLSVMADALAFSLVDFSGAVVFERAARFGSMPINHAVTWMAEMIETARAALDVPAGGIVGAGLAIPGSFIANDQGFNTPHYLEEWAGVDITARFREMLGLPVWADNDGNCAALAESINGAGRWARNFAYLYISAGVGGGVVLNGELWPGRHGNAGEFAGGLPSDIYPFPNLELLRQLLAREGESFATVGEMIAAFDPTWPAIGDWVQRVRDSLSIIASNASAILDLDAIVLGGRLPRALAERVIPAITLFDQRRRTVPRPVARIVPAESAGDPAAAGAAMRPLKALYFD
jgi:predicted NBD/HSP70 family sugar kinase